MILSGGCGVAGQEQWPALDALCLATAMPAGQGVRALQSMSEWKPLHSKGTAVDEASTGTRTHV